MLHGHRSQLPQPACVILSALDLDEGGSKWFQSAFPWTCEFLPLWKTYLNISQLRQVAKDENHRRSKRLLTDFSKCLTCFRLFPTPPTSRIWMDLGTLGGAWWCWMLVSKFANSSVENAVRSVASINRGRLASCKRSCLETIIDNRMELL